MYSIYTAATDGKLHLASWKVNASLLPPRRSPAGASLFLQVKLRRGRRIEMSNVTRYGNDTTLSREIFRKKRKTRKRDKKKEGNLKKTRENGESPVNFEFEVSGLSRSLFASAPGLLSPGNSMDCRYFHGTSLQTGCTSPAGFTTAHKWEMRHVSSRGISAWGLKKFN